MEVLLQEARDAYDSEQVVELKSEKTGDVDANAERIEQWVKNWKKDHNKDGDVKAQGESGKKDEDDPMFLHG
jgi:adenylate kinase